MTTWLTALVLLASAQERHVNNDPAQAYPWWTEPADSRKPTDLKQAAAPAIAVSRANVVTQAWSHDNMIVVTDNVHEARNENGWSNPVPVPDQMTGLTLCNARVDIAYDANHILHVVYEGVEYNDNPLPGEDPLFLISHIYYAKRLQNGQWVSPVRIRQGSRPGVDTLYLWSWPRVAIDAANVPHFTALERYFQGQSSAAAEERRTVHYSNGGSSWEKVCIGQTPDASGKVSGTTDHPEYYFAPLSIASETGGQAVHITWLHNQEPLPGKRGTYPIHAAKYGGGWTAMTPLTAPGVFSYDVSVFAAQEDKKAHVVYLRTGDETGVGYRVRNTGSGGGFSQAEDVTLEVATSLPRIVVDSRLQPNVVYRLGSAFCFAAKVGSTWEKQEPIQHIQARVGSILDVEINRNDGLYFTTGPGTNLQFVDNYPPGEGYAPDYYVPTSGGGTIWYVRSFDPNLGAQDGPVHVPFGPGTTVNAANGGVVHALPLFAAKGVGFPAALQLTYNALEWDRGAISQGWTHNYHVYLVDHKTGLNTTSDRITVWFGDGHAVNFKYVGAPTSRHLAQDEYGYSGNIVRDGSLWTSGTAKYVLTTKSGVQYAFDQFGKLERLLDTNGNSVQLTYNADDAKRYLVEVKDSTNRTVTFSYGTGTKIQQITDPGGGSYSLFYADGDPGVSRLQTVNFNAGVVWQYAHHAADDPDPNVRGRVNLLSQVQTPRGNVTKLKYHPDNRAQGSQDPVLSQPSIKDDDSEITQHPDRTLAYSDPAQPTAGTRPSATFVNRRGASSTIETEYRRSIARRITDFNGFPILREFDGTYRNLTSLTDQSGNVTSYTYDTASVPSWVKDNLKELKPPSANSSLGSGSGPATATYTYTSPTGNSAFRIASLTDALGNTTSYTYDEAGNLTKITHPIVDGVAAEETFEVDGQGRTVKSRAPRGGETIYVYGDGATGLATQIFRPEHGAPEQFIYDSMGNVTYSVRPRGGVTQTTYDALYRPQIVTAPAGDEPAVTSYGYDAESNVTVVMGPGACSASNTYDELGRLVQTSKNVSSGVDAVTRTGYDPEGNVRRSTDARGKVTLATFDAVGRMLSEDRPGGPGPALVSSFAYNANGTTLTSVVGGQTTTFTVTGRGAVKQTDSPITGIRDLSTFYEDGLVDTTIHEASGAATHGNKQIFDARRRLISSIRLTNFAAGTGVSRTYVHDADGNVILQVDGAGRRRSTEFDLAGRAIRTRDHNGVITSETTYDDDDQPQVVKTLHAESSQLVVSRLATYNLRGEMQASVDALGNTTEARYDARGNIKLLRTPAAAVSGGGVQSCFTAYEYDLSNRLVRHVHDPGTPGQVAHAFGYDENGNQTVVVDPRGFVYLKKYDDAGRLIEMSYPSPDGASYLESWGYDNRGNMVSHTDCNGKAATYQYDALNRMTRETHVRAGVILADIERTYDGASNPLTIKDNVSRVVVSFTEDSGLPAYDSLNRLKQVRWFLELSTFWKKVQYKNGDGSAAYDAAGNLLRMVDPEGHVFSYAYDEHNHLASIQRAPVVGAAALVAAMTYHPSGRRRDMTMHGGIRTAYHYDAKARLTSVETVKADGTSLSRYDYEYDARDRRTQAKLHHLVTRVNYTYDCLNRLTGEEWSANSSPAPELCANATAPATAGNKTPLVSQTAVSGAAGGIPTVAAYTWSCTYDASGNRLTQNKAGATTTYTYDAQNRLSQQQTAGGNTVAYTYDRNANLLSRSEAGVLDRFSYDYANRLSAFERGPVGSPTTSTLTRFAPGGERIAKVNLLASAANEEWFMYDGADAAADYLRTTGTLSFSLQRTYVNGSAIDSKIARIDAGASEAMYLYLGDAVGTVTRLIDSAGVLKNDSLRTAWGEPLPGFASSAAVPDRHQFSQREEDTESGLMHYRARGYDPRIGRFLQRDPIRSRFLTHFTYADNSPALYVDPTGCFTAKLHSIMTREALDQSVTKGGKRFDYGVSVFIGKEVSGIDIANHLSPVQYPSKDEQHFDNSDFKGGLKFIEDSFRNIADPVKTDSVKKAQIRFGWILHAIEDFYSHSDYVERWLDTMNPGIVRPEEQVATGEPPVWNRQLVVFGKALVTGVWPDSKGTPALLNHAELSKDDEGHKRGGVRIFSGQSLHSLARMAAERDVREVMVDRFEQAVRLNPHFNGQVGTRDPFTDQDGSWDAGPEYPWKGEYKPPRGKR